MINIKYVLLELLFKLIIWFIPRPTDKIIFMLMIKRQSTGTLKSVASDLVDDLGWW